MSTRRRERHVRIIAKERPFDEERWKELLTAFAYVLHEQRKAQGTREVPTTHDTHARESRPGAGAEGTR